MSESGPLVRRHVCVRAHIRAAFTSSWCIPLYTRIRQPSGLPHLEHSAKLRLELTYTGEREEKRKFCWQLQLESPLCPHHKAQNTSALLQFFLFPTDTVFAESHTWLLKIRSHKTQAVTKLIPMKVTSKIFQKGYKESNLRSEKRGFVFTYLSYHYQETMKRITTRKIPKVQNIWH